jgi:hypothetical protein
MNVRVAAKRKPSRKLLVVLPILLVSCGTNPPLRSMSCESAVAPTIFTSPDGKTKSTTLKVLTFNIEGLGFPARKGREVQLAQIGERLSAMRAAGTGPDVVMFQ